MSDMQTRNTLKGIALLVIGTPLLVVDTLGMFKPMSVSYWLELIGLSLGIRWLFSALIYGVVLNWIFSLFLDP